MERPENPPAFPVSSIDGFTQHGMDLRDWFAGQALAGICATLAGANLNYSVIAYDAYRLADAMLAEREKSK